MKSILGILVMAFLAVFTNAQEKSFPRHCVDRSIGLQEFQVAKSSELPMPGDAMIVQRVYYRGRAILIAHMPGPDRRILILGAFVRIEERARSFVFFYRPLKDSCAKTRDGIRLRLKHRFRDWTVGWLH